METTKKLSNFSFFFKRINRKVSGGGGSRRWKSRISIGLRWKRRFSLRNWIVDHFIFKILLVFEAIFLASKLCFFFLCCGCGRF